MAGPAPAAAAAGFGQRIGAEILRPPNLAGGDAGAGAADLAVADVEGDIPRAVALRDLRRPLMACTARRNL